MIPITFSKLDLAEECTFWSTLDCPDVPSEAAAEGTRKHAAISAYIETGARIDEPWFTAWAKWWDKNKPAGETFCEFPFAYNPDTGTARRLISESQRDYSNARPGELTGTTDLVCIPPDGPVLVWDWKTGASKPASKAWESLQLGAGALCAANMRGRSSASVAYKFIGKARTTTDSADLDAPALEVVRHRLLAIVRASTVPRVGNHCDELYCPGRSLCAAYREAYGLPKQAPQVQQQQEKKPMGRMTLDNVKRGVIPEPHRILLYGVEGIGKSTFGAHSPAPIFINSERGTSELDVARFPEPTCWADVLEAVETLRGEHEFQTVVFDTVDWLEPLCIAHVCAKNGWDSIEKPAWGAGYTAAMEEWRGLLDKLDTLQDSRRLNVILLGHCVTRGHRHPELADFDRFELAINKKAAGLLKQWASTVLFCDYETETFEERNRVRAIDSGARIIHTNWRAAFDAKNRMGLPAKIPLSWDDFAESCAKSAATPEADEKRATITEILAAANNPKLSARVEADVKKAGSDTAKLGEIINRLNARKQQAA